MSGLGSGVVVVCGAEQRQEETSRMLSLMQCVYTNENCFRQWDPTPIEQWGPRLLWHLRKTVAQDTDRANPYHRATGFCDHLWRCGPCVFGGQKMGFFRPRMSDPSTRAERKSQENEPLEVKPA